jgi:hypothetical protein
MKKLLLIAMLFAVGGLVRAAEQNKYVPADFVKGIIGKELQINKQEAIARGWVFNNYQAKDLLDNEIVLYQKTPKAKFIIVQIQNPKAQFPYFDGDGWGTATSYSSEDAITIARLGKDGIISRKIEQMKVLRPVRKLEEKKMLEEIEGEPGA